MFVLLLLTALAQEHENPKLPPPLEMEVCAPEIVGHPELEPIFGEQWVQPEPTLVLPTASHELETHREQVEACHRALSKFLAVARGQSGVGVNRINRINRINRPRSQHEQILLLEMARVEKLIEEIDGKLGR